VNWLFIDDVVLQQNPSSEPREEGCGFRAQTEFVASTQASNNRPTPPSHRHEHKAADRDQMTGSLLENLIFPLPCPEFTSLASVFI